MNVRSVHNLNNIRSITDCSESIALPGLPVANPCKCNFLSHFYPVWQNWIQNEDCVYADLFIMCKCVERMNDFRIFDQSNWYGGLAAGKRKLLTPFICGVTLLRWTWGLWRDHSACHFIVCSLASGYSSTLDITRYLSASSRGVESKWRHPDKDCFSLYLWES